MNDDGHTTLTYRILRYVPNLIRDEWLNIGVLLEHSDGTRRAMRVIEDDAEIARVRRFYPGADDALLRALPSEFDARFQESGTEAVAKYLGTLDQTLSTALQLSPQVGVFSDDFDAELDRLYHDHVAPPPRTRSGILESTRGWIKARSNDVFLRRRVPRLARNIRVEEFTQPGDPMRLDYGYTNGVRGYLQAVALGRDTAQAKVLAYTAERIRIRLPDAEFTAITEVEPARDNRRQQFMVRLFEQQQIAIVPLNRIEKFAEELRVRLQ